jgi:hypothetical protein
VTWGFGTPKTDSWTGSRKIAPDTPTGLVIVAVTRPAMNPNRSCSEGYSSSSWTLSIIGTGSPCEGIHRGGPVSVAVRGKDAPYWCEAASSQAGVHWPGVTKSEPAPPRCGNRQRRKLWVLGCHAQFGGDGELAVSQLGCRYGAR